jgi:hypothetical protein
LRSFVRRAQVVVAADSLYSTPVALVSFAAPNITSVSCVSCRSVSPLELLDCPRVNSGGGVVLVVNGTNFGLGAVSVFVGGSICALLPSVPGRDPNRQRACLLPSGSVSRALVLLVQQGGQLSSAASSAVPAVVGYRQCDAPAASSALPADPDRFPWRLEASPACRARLASSHLPTGPPAAPNAIRSVIPCE